MKRELVFETRIQLDDDDIEDETLIDNLLTFTKCAILNSTLDSDLGFGISIKEYQRGIECPLSVE